VLMVEIFDVIGVAPACVRVVPAVITEPVI
jgi:hypothetical protein